MKDGKTTCGANRPKDLEEYDFEVPEILGTLWPQQHYPRCSFGHGSPPEEEEFVDPTERETEFFNELEPVRSFHPLGHSSPFIAERPEHHSPPL